MNHKDLDVWKEAIKLVQLIYEFTKALPEDERFGLISQMRRAAVSVPSNIAEGAARKSNKELIQFTYIALGSIAEIETQLILANKLFGLPNSIESNQLENCKRLSLGFIKYLKSKS